MPDSENLQTLVQGTTLNVVPLTSNVEGRELVSNTTPYTLSLRRDDIEDEKELKRFVKSVEGLVRKSPEYRVWTDYVREVLGHLNCKLTKETHGQTTVDIHHHPISLFVITKGVISRYIASSKDFCSFDICTKIIELHYELRIGFMPIISSLHEKFHRGFLALPIELASGDYKHFIDNYGSFIEDEDLEVIQARTAITFETCGYGSDYFWSRDTYHPNPIEAVA
jgi:hypothetical protein